MKKKLFLSIIIFFTTNLVFANTFGDFAEKFINKKWILEYYNEIVFYQNKEILINYIPNYNIDENYLRITKCDYWFDELSDVSIIYVLSDAFEIENILQLEENIFKLELKSINFDYERYKKNLENGCDWQKYNIQIDTLYIKFDGEYLYIFLNEETELLAIYCAYDNSEYNLLYNYIHANSILDSGITLPRHADGTCDYDGSTKKVTAANTSQPKASVAGNTNTNTNVAVKKTMSVAENLKLRSGEATSTQVLAVMSAGTKVKILELGKAETIDGINSNWVKVEVQAGAKDRDGKEIKAGTVGWCYGGYLK